MIKHGYFLVPEFIPPEIYLLYGDFSIKLMKKETVLTANQVRNFFNVPVICNNWFFDNGLLKYRGFRPHTIIKSESGQTLAINGKHRSGESIDLTVSGVSAKHVLKSIIENPFVFCYIEAVYIVTENTIHIQTNPNFNNGIIKILNIKAENV